MNNRIYLAPLQGLTDYTFRNTYIKHFTGINIALTPFVSTVKGNKINPSHIKGLLPENNSGMPIIPQILGKDPDEFIVLAKHLYELGYDVINWNLGCPAPGVSRKKRGSGLLPYPEIIDSFLEKVLSCIPNKLSIKIRNGYHNEEEILTLLPLLNKYPLTEIIIHPRTAKQMYEGIINYDLFKKCLIISRHLVVYNGDINNYEKFNVLCTDFGDSVSSWMIGRGVIANPLLPGIIKRGGDIELINSKKIVKEFYDALYEEYSKRICGPVHLINKMKEFWFYLSRSFENSKKVLKRIRKVTNVNKYHAEVETIFAQEEWIA